MSQQESKTTILLADDEEDSRYAFQLGLEMNGYEVLISRNGKEVLEQLSAAQSKSKNIDLIITDFHMPGISGKELIDSLLAFEHTPPILVISGFQDQSLTKELEKRGSIGYINKPITFSEMTERIEKLLNETQESPGLNAAREGSGAIIRKSTFDMRHPSEDLK